MEIYYKTWPEVETYLKNKKDIIIPIGSTEQHGPTGIIGTDFLTAWEVAKRVGEKTQTMVASPLCYGMALHHMAFPGSASLKPSTLIQVIKEVVESYALHGFQKFTFINGHGGNIPTITAAFSEILCDKQKYEFKIFNWWTVEAVTKYEEKHFGEKNGFHATCGEISATMSAFPEAHKTERALNYFETPSKYSWPQSPGVFRETFPDGRMGSDPRLSSKEHGDQILTLAVNHIAERI